MHIHVHHYPNKETADRLCRIEAMLGTIISNLELTMSTIADFEAALSAIDSKVSTVKTDVDGLISKLAAIPAPGLTPEQQAAIDAAVAHANSIAASLGAIDTTVNPAPAPAV